MISIYIFTTVILTLVWIILCGSLSLFTVLTGFIISISCILFAVRYLPLYNINGIKTRRLLLYPIYLLGKIYVSALISIKMVLTKSYADVISFKTALNNDFLKVLLSHSVTLTPGTISLDLRDDIITVLCLKDRNTSPDDICSTEVNIRKTEAKLLKAQTTDEQVSV